MGTETELLKRIVEKPGETGLRLLYSDLREKAGDHAHAEFIRLQCEMEELEGWDPAREELERRERELLEEGRSRWAAALSDITGHIRFRRGFVEEVTVGVDDFLRRGGEILRLAPVRSIQIDEDEDGPEAMRRLAACPHLSEIHELNLRNVIAEPEGIDALLSSARLDRLRSLILSDEDSTPEVAAVIAAKAPEGLTGLHFIGYMEGNLGDRGLKALAASPRLRGLETANFYNCRIGAAGMKALSDSPHIRGLSHLSLGLGQYSLNQIGPEGAAEVARSGNFAGLTYLSLDFNGVQDEGIVAMAKSPHLGKLEWLTLQANKFGDEGLRALAGSPVLDPVRLLDVSHNAVGPEGVRALVQARPRSVRNLWLYHNPIGDEGVRILAESELLSQLMSLSIHNCGITDIGVDALLNSPHIDGLRKLRIGLNKLTDKAKARLRERFRDVTSL